jgi:hypothetical protein
MSGVFVSYRREDSSGYAGRLFDILSTHFGIENTYMDLDTIMVGDNFETVIEEKISQCDVLLAVIGERWLIGKSAGPNLWAERRQRSNFPAGPYYLDPECDSEKLSRGLRMWLGQYSYSHTGLW